MRGGWLAATYTLMRNHERIHHADSAIEPIVLKVLGENFGQAIMFRIRPKVRVDPIQLVRRTATHRITQDCFVRIRNRELFQEFFRLALVGPALA